MTSYDAAGRRSGRRQTERDWSGRKGSASLRVLLRTAFARKGHRPQPSEPLSPSKSAKLNPLAHRSIPSPTNRSQTINLLSRLPNGHPHEHNLASLPSLNPSSHKNGVLIHHERCTTDDLVGAAKLELENSACS